MTLSRTLLATPFLFLLGCGDGSGGKLTGTVTVDGQPLKRGSVRLEPDGGSGSPAGGMVQNGKYEVTGVKPGRYKLHVDGEIESAGPVSQEEVMKRTEKEHKAVTQNPVPPGAAGNDAVVEVTGSTQTHDVKLTSPAKR